MTFCRDRNYKLDVENGNKKLARLGIQYVES